MTREKDWLAQAVYDLQAAQSNLQAKSYEWCCFQCQQAAEKAAKALLIAYQVVGWGHSVFHLLSQAKDYVQIPDELLSAARELDRHYIQGRYPNGFPEGFPHEYYDEEIAKISIEHAERIVQFVRNVLPSVSS